MLLQSGLDRGWITLVNNEIIVPEYVPFDFDFVPQHGHGTKTSGVINA